MKKYGAIILLPVIGFILLCIGAVTYPPTPVSGTGPVVGSNSGSGTNNTFTTPTLSGTVIISNTPWGAYNDSFTLNGQVGPTIIDFFGQLSGHNLTFQGGDSGMLWANKTATVYQMSLGHDWRFSLRDTRRLRLYDAEDSTDGPAGNDVMKARAGTTASIYAPFYGGSAAMLQDLPVHGGDLAQRMPQNIMYISTAGSLAGGARPVTNNANTFFVTNTVIQGFSNGVYNTVFAAGDVIEVGLEIGWSAEFRNPDGSLRWNTNNYPEGPVWMSNWLHTNRCLAVLQIYYNPSCSNSTQTGLVIDDGGHYLAPVMTADRVTSDTHTLVSWGFDGWLAADMNSIVSAEGIGYIHGLDRQLGEETLDPQGLTPRNQTAGISRPLHLEHIKDMRGFPNSSAAYEVTMMHDGNTPAPTVTSPNGVAGAIPMYLARWTWTNMAWMAGKGHYISELQLPVGRTWNTNNNYADTAADGFFALAMNAMYPTKRWVLDSWNNPVLTNAASATLLTNLALFKIAGDSAYAPAFPLYDYGSNSVSCWIKPLANGFDYAVVLANETGTSSNLTLNWATNIVSPPSFFPVNSPLYPVAIPTNSVFQFLDIQNGTNVPSTVFNSFTVSVTNHSCRMFRVTRKSGGTDGIISYATDATYALNTTGCTNTLGKNATAYVTATAVAFTVKDSAGTTLYTSPTLTATVCVHLQPLWSVNSASGLSGTVVRD